MADQVLRTNKVINFANTVPAGAVNADIEWVSLHNADTPASGTAYLKIDVTDVVDLVLGSTVRLPANMTMITYPNDSEAAETETLGTAMLQWLKDNGFYAIAHDGDPGTEAQFFGQNQITGIGAATVGSGDLEIVDA